jgi:hypothetical protein
LRISEEGVGFAAVGGSNPRFAAISLMSRSLVEWEEPSSTDWNFPVGQSTAGKREKPGFG